MSTHAEDRFEGWDRERLIEEVESLREQLENAEFELENQGLSDFSDDAIRAEFYVRDLGCDPSDMTALFEAFHLGRIDKAMELAKSIACAHTGRFL